MRAARRFENPRKIKRPGGDFARGYDTAVFGASSYFVWVNRGKESVILDLARSQDKARLRGRWRSPTCLAAGYVKGSWLAACQLRCPMTAHAPSRIPPSRHLRAAAFEERQSLLDEIKLADS